MPLFAKSDRFSRHFGQTWTTLGPKWRPVGPLAGLAELQNGCKSHSWDQSLTNLSTQSSAVDLHAQPNPRICYTWPSSWLHFLRFCDQIGWHGFGQARGPSSLIGQTAQTLFWQFGTGLASWASLAESVRMPSTGKPKAAQGTDEGRLQHGGKM